MDGLPFLAVRRGLLAITVKVDQVIAHHVTAGRTLPVGFHPPASERFHKVPASPWFTRTRSMRFRAVLLGDCIMIGIRLIFGIQNHP